MAVDITKRRAHKLPGVAHQPDNDSFTTMSKSHSFSKWAACTWFGWCLLLARPRRMA